MQSEPRQVINEADQKGHPGDEQDDPSIARRRNDEIRLRGMVAFCDSSIAILRIIPG